MASAPANQRTSAPAEGYRTRALDYDLGHVAGDRPLANGYPGKAHMVVDEDHQVVTGATFVGAMSPSTF